MVFWNSAICTKIDESKKLNLKIENEWMKRREEKRSRKNSSKDPEEDESDQYRYRYYS